MGRHLRSPEGHEGDPAPDPAPDPTPDLSLIGGDPKPEGDPAPKSEGDPAPKESDPEPAPEPLTVEALKLPEGFELQPEIANKFLEILNQGDMAPGDRANALLALHSETINAALEADSKAWENMQTEWKDTVKADPEIGGAKLQPAIANIGKLINEFGSDDLKGVFDMTGAGNNVHVIKFLDKIANVLTEGNFFKAGSPGATNDPDAAAKRMFPSMKG